MSQVDYVHFYVNILWTMIQITILYVIICIIYVQSFYKVLRLRFRIYGIIIILINKIFLFTNFILVFFKNIKKVFFNLINNIKVNLVTFFQKLNTECYFDFY